MQIFNTRQKTVCYTFRDSQIAEGEIGDFLNVCDPARLSDRQLRNLLGALVVRFESVADNETIPTHAALRALLGRVHARWPWAGYFLNLEQPLGGTNPVNDHPLFAFGLCVCDFKLGLWFQQREVFIEVGPQLSQYRKTCHEALDTLARRARLPARRVLARHRAITQQFQHVLSP